MRRFAARVCLAAGLGIAVPALPAFAEVLVLSGAERAPVGVVAVSLGHPPPATGQSAALTQPPRERSERSQLLMLVVALILIGMITLWRG